jgi:hypothetical protein
MGLLPRLCLCLYNPMFLQAMYFACCLFHGVFVLGLHFTPEDGGDMFLWNVSWLSVDYMALYCRRYKFAKPYWVQNIGATANYELVVFGYVTILIFF